MPHPIPTGISTPTRPICRNRAVPIALAFAAAWIAAPPPARGQPLTAVRATVDDAGGQINLASSTDARRITNIAISGNGRFVGFAVPGSVSPFTPFGADSYYNVYARDLISNRTAGINRKAADTFTWVYPESLSPSFSDTGRHAAFRSNATQLLPSQTINGQHIYAADRDADNDGIFDENGTGARRIALLSARVSALEPGNSPSDHPSVSATGRFVAFESAASNLVTGDTNGDPIRAVGSDVFVVDRDFDGNGVFDEAQGNRRKVVRVSVASNGQQTEYGAVSGYPAISADGRFVAFESNSHTLVANDSNKFPGIFLHDRDVDADGIFDEAGAISTTRISVGIQPKDVNAPCYRPAISADGRYVIFDSTASNLVAGDTNNASDVFLYDRIARTLECVSRIDGGAVGNAASYAGSISGDGGLIAFSSLANNLAPGDTNPSFDIFLSIRNTPPAPPGRHIVRLDFQTTAGSIEVPLVQPLLSTDGSRLVFVSAANNLVLSDTNRIRDAFAVSLPIIAAKPADPTITSDRPTGPALTAPVEDLTTTPPGTTHIPIEGRN